MKKFNLEQTNVNFSSAKEVTKIVKMISERIEELGLKKSHVAKHVVPSEDASTLSNFLAMKQNYVNEDRIVKYCKYLDSVNTAGGDGI